MTSFNFSQNNAFIFNYGGNVSVNQNSYSSPTINDSVFQFPYSSCKDNSNIDLMFNSFDGSCTSVSALNPCDSSFSGDSFLNDLGDWFYSTMDSIFNSQSSNSYQPSYGNQNIGMFEQFMNQLMAMFMQMFNQVTSGNVDQQCPTPYQPENQTPCQPQPESYQPQPSPCQPQPTPCQPQPTVITTGSGNDCINVSPGTGLTILDTGAGNDYIGILPGVGDIYVNAGAGNDIIEAAITNQQGYIYVNGGEGFDTLNLYDYTNTGMNVNYLAEGTQEQLTVNIGGQDYILGNDIEALNIYGPNGELNIINYEDLQQGPQTFNLEYGDTDYAVQYEDGRFTAQVGGVDLELTVADNGHVQTVADGKLWDLGLVSSDGDGTFSTDESKAAAPVNSVVADYKLNYDGVDYTVTQHINDTFTAKVGDEDIPIYVKEDGMVVVTANGDNQEIGKLVDDKDGTFSVDKTAVAS